jgi:2-methylcitrate dehydratase PrpD
MLTRELGNFVARVGTHGVPAEARAVAKIGFVDTIATMIAGSREDAVRILRTVLEPLPAGRSRLWFSGRRCAAPEAAWLNGVATHALDFDDVALRGHPSAVLVPAILAEAEELGATCNQMLDAYVAGYEVWANLVDRESDMHHAKGWHPTGVFGPIAAAAACASLRKLEASQCSNALGLGASQSAGIMSNFGSMAKPFHAGRAAHAGLISARLGSAGFTTSPDALEHPQGFLSAISPRGNVDRERPVGTLGECWQISERRMNLKKYPTCYYTHRALDAIFSLLSGTSIDHRNVIRAEVSISREHALVLRNHAPADALAAKFSMEFAMAGALVAGKMGFPELRDDFVRSPAVQQLYPCVTVKHATVYDPGSPGWALHDQVTVTMTDGSIHVSDPVRHARGHAAVPLLKSELRAKFLECLNYGSYDGDAQRLFEQIDAMEALNACGLGSDVPLRATTHLRGRDD